MESSRGKCQRCGEGLISHKNRGRPKIFCSKRCQSADSSARDRRRKNPRLLTVEERNNSFAERVWRQTIIPELTRPQVVGGPTLQIAPGQPLRPKPDGVITGWNESRPPETSPDSTENPYATRKLAESALERAPTFVQHIRLHATATRAASGDVVRGVLADWVKTGFVPLAEIEAQAAILPEDWVSGPYQRLKKTLANKRHAQLETPESEDALSQTIPERVESLETRQSVLEETLRSALEDVARAATEFAARIPEDGRIAGAVDRLLAEIEEIGA